MTTMTSYGNWTTVEHYSVSVEQTITEALSDWADEYDIDAIARDYRRAINDALPDGVALAGDEFYGPYYAADQHFDGYPLDEIGALDIKAIIDGIDLWAIITRHEQPTT